MKRIHTFTTNLGPVRITIQIRQLQSGRFRFAIQNLRLRPDLKPALEGR